MPLLLQIPRSRPAFSHYNRENIIKPVLFAGFTDTVDARSSWSCAGPEIFNFVESPDAVLCADIIVVAFEE